jgi:hypothetical protein
LFIYQSAAAQSDTAQNNYLKFEAECVSSYVWRGVPAQSVYKGKTLYLPNLQPTLSANWGNFETGIWTSVDCIGSLFEFDLFASYTHRGLTATLTDYYTKIRDTENPYFNWKQNSTGHILEGMLTFEPEKIPIEITVASMLYGADKMYQEDESDLAKNNYSTYIELKYLIEYEDFNFELFAGYSPNDGYYGDGYGSRYSSGLVNTGISTTKTIALKKMHELYVKASFFYNPQLKNTYIVFAIGI